ncbi:hypothetical protein BH24ACI3_BH24ACI3_10230 [soil metagenome]
MAAIGRIARSPVRVYFTGGTTAVLYGWRNSTIDIDLRFEPVCDEVFRALPELKERLSINIELASPSDLIPPLPGWEDRSQHTARQGKVGFYHYDPYSQALAKIERGHDQDINDVKEMIRRGLVEVPRMLTFFENISPLLYRYPAIDPASFAEAVIQIAADR